MAVPAVAVPGALTVKCDAAAALTVMAPLVPVMVPVTPLVLLSVAEIVLLPAVVNVALKVANPLVRVLGLGNTVEAPTSVLVKVAVPV